MCLRSNVRSCVSEEWLLLVNVFSLLCMSLKSWFKDIKNPFYVSGFLEIHVYMCVCTKTYTCIIMSVLIFM